MNEREVLQGEQYQGEDEAVAYTLDVSRVGNSPTSVSVTVKNATTGEDVTDEVMPTNMPSVSGNVITLSHLRNLTKDVIYRVEVKYTIAGNTFENYFFVHGQE